MYPSATTFPRSVSPARTRSRAADQKSVKAAARKTTITRPPVFAMLCWGLSVVAERVMSSQGEVDDFLSE